MNGKFYKLAALSALLIALGAVLMTRAVRAQVDSTLQFGANFNATFDATEYMNVPACSKAAGCVAQLEICNMLPGTQRADSTKCIFIGNGLVGGSSLWLGINQTQTVAATGTTPAQTTSSPFQIGTANSNVTAGEARQTP